MVEMDIPFWGLSVKQGTQTSLPQRLMCGKSVYQAVWDFKDVHSYPVVGVRSEVECDYGCKFLLQNPLNDFYQSPFPLWRCAAGVCLWAGHVLFLGHYWFLEGKVQMQGQWIDADISTFKHHVAQGCDRVEIRVDLAYILAPILEMLDRKLKKWAKPFGKQKQLGIG